MPSFFRGLNKSETKEAVRGELSKHGFMEEFESAFISGLIAEKHYFLSTCMEQPTRFRKVFSPTPAGYDFEGHFPLRGWRRVSWAKCLQPDVAVADLVTGALRLATKGHVAAHKAAHANCELCGARAEEVDHAEPEFKTLVRDALNRTSEKGLRSVLGSFDYWSDNPFEIPSDSDLYRHFIAAHNNCKLVSVCKPCHRKSAKARRHPQRD